MSIANRAKRGEGVKAEPLRVTVRDAAERLDVCAETVRRLIRSGTLRGIYPRGMGPGKPVYLDAGELEMYARGRFAELQDMALRGLA